MPKFHIENPTGPNAKPRLVATEKMTGSDFCEIATALNVTAIRARKIGFVAARQANTPTEIETRWNGKESSITAEPGDWIVSNMTPARELMRDGEGHLNVYAIRADTFPSLYVRDKGATDEGAIYRAISEVDAIFFPGGFEITPPWAKAPGDVQRADTGYILLNGNEVYGNAQETFEATYVVVK